MTNLTSVSIFSLVSQADIVVKSVMAILLIASLISWAVIFDKIIKFRSLKKKSNRFEDIFEKADTLDETYIDAKKNNNHPLARVFLACMSEWKLNKISEISNNGEKKNSLKERLFGAMKVASNKSVEKLEFGLNFLAIVGSSAPFVGLFGTVWGIMNSFQGIAASKNTSLAVVAPGIAEALLATALGLFAAIPAVFFYNIFSSKINNFIERVENFSVSLLNILSRELDR